MLTYTGPTSMKFMYQNNQHEQCRSVSLVDMSKYGSEKSCSFGLGRGVFLISSLGERGHKTTSTRLETASACVRVQVPTPVHGEVSMLIPDSHTANIESNLGLIWKSLDYIHDVPELIPDMHYISSVDL